LLVKPDEKDYKFENFFRYDSFTGEILVNTSKSEENQKRASKTIEIFRLNIGNKPRNRITAIKKEIECNTPFDERPYRYGY
jgi:predicted Ser/Thr protein kinase